MCSCADNGLTVHESPEVPGTILGLVRSRVEEIQSEAALWKTELANSENSISIHLERITQLEQQVARQHEELRRVAEFANGMAKPVEYADDTIYLKHLKNYFRMLQMQHDEFAKLLEGR